MPVFSLPIPIPLQWRAAFGEVGLVRDTAIFIVIPSVVLVFFAHLIFSLEIFSLLSLRIYGEKDD
jgi:hypothetical protein